MYGTIVDLVQSKLWALQPRLQQVYLRDGVRLIIPVFVDDITIAGKDKAAIQRVKDDLRKHFKL